MDNDTSATNNKDSKNKPFYDQYDGKLKATLLTDGYIRIQFITKHSIINQIFPETLNQLIFTFYYVPCKLLQFSTSIICSRYNNSQFKLTHNNCKATKIKTGPFCWMVSDLENGIKEGINVWRFKIDNQQTLDIMWGVSPFKKITVNTSYTSPYVYGWYSTGSFYAGSCSEYLIKTVKFGFQGKHRYILLDLKLDCTKNTLSFVTLSLDNKINNAECIGKECVYDKLPQKVTNNEGWAPHFLFYYAGTSASICQIDPSFYGVSHDDIDNILNI
eukprot:322595_1